MGGKDSPPPQCSSISPMQSPKLGGGHRTQRSHTFSSAKPSPIEYVPRNKTAVNVDLRTPCSETNSIQSQTLPRGRSAQPESREDGSYSPIRAYMECFQPQTLKCALVGDSGVGKTSMLMAYTVDKFPEEHAPTIFDKFSSKFACCRDGTGWSKLLKTTIKTCLDLWVYLFSFSCLQLHYRCMERGSLSHFATLQDRYVYEEIKSVYRNYIVLTSK